MHHAPVLVGQRLAWLFDEDLEFKTVARKVDSTEPGEWPLLRWITYGGKRR
jgi:hypothetical protein